MTIEERMDRLEAKLGSQDEMVRELRDAVTVTARLEAQQGRLARGHSEAIVEHEKWLQEHDAAMKAHDFAMKQLDTRISDLVSGFGEFMRRVDR